MVRKIALVLSTLVLVTTGVLGLYNGLSDLGDAQTAFQRSVTIGVILYGAIGLVAAAALVLRRRSSLWLAIGWAIVVTYVASTAALAYGGAEVTLAAAFGGGLGAALVGAGVVWTARQVIRARAPTARADQPT